MIKSQILKAARITLAKALERWQPGHTTDQRHQDTAAPIQDARYAGGVADDGSDQPLQ